MDHTLRVRRGDALNELDGEIVERVERHRGAHPFAERHPVDVFHHQHDLVFEVEDVVDGGDAAVADLARAASFLEDRGTLLAAIGSRGQQTLEGDAAVEQRVARQQHLAHAAPAEQFLDPIATQQRILRACGPGGIAAGTLRHVHHLQP